jgi:hypothetical protein
MKLLSAGTAPFFARRVKVMPKTAVAAGIIMMHRTCMVRKYDFNHARAPFSRVLVAGFGYIFFAFGKKR